MAQRAILREIGCHVIRYAGDRCGTAVILGVTSVAIRRQGSRVIVGMAGRAGHRGMCAGERE